MIPQVYRDVDILESLQEIILLSFFLDELLKE